MLDQDGSRSDTRRLMEVNWQHHRNKTLNPAVLLLIYIKNSSTKKPFVMSQKRLTPLQGRKSLILWSNKVILLVLLLCLLPLLLLLCPPVLLRSFSCLSLQLPLPYAMPSGKVTYCKPHSLVKFLANFKVGPCVCIRHARTY